MTEKTNENTLTFKMLKGRMVTYTGKVGSGLLTFSKELMVDALNEGLRVAYITSSKNLNSIMEALPNISISDNLTLYPINEGSLNDYPDGFLEDSVHQINSENYDVVMINSSHLLSPIEKELLITQQNDVVTYIFEQESFQTDTAEDILSQLDSEIRNRSLQIIHLEKRTGYDFTTVKDRGF